MNTNPEDEQLRAMFGTLRQAELGRVPAFDANNRADLRMTSIWGQLRYGRVAALAAVLLIACAVGIWSHPRAEKAAVAIKFSTPAAPNTDAAADALTPLANWESPTAVLLQAPDEWGRPAGASAEPANNAPSTRPDTRHST
jgi:hypothetical protein